MVYNEGFLQPLFHFPLRLCCVVNITGFDEAGHVLRNPLWPPSWLFVKFCVIKIQWNKQFSKYHFTNIFILLIASDLAKPVRIEIYFH